MSRVNASLYIDSDLGISGWPYTIFCWVKRRNDAPAVQYPTLLYNTSTDYGSIQMGSTYYAVSRNYNGSSDIAVTESGTTVPTDWHPMLAVFNTNYVILYTNLYTTGPNTSSTGTWATNSSPRFCIGYTYALASWYVSKIAHVAVWNTVLSEASRTALLGATKTPDQVSETANLRAYWPFTDSVDYNISEVNSYTLSTGGTYDADDNPTITSGADVTYAYTLSIS